MTDAYPKGNFWDNLLSIKGGTSGQQTAGWTPGAPAAAGLGCQVVADQMIPVADGVQLAADVYLPKKPGRYPTILVFGAYTKELHAAGIPAGTNEVGSPPVFTDRGYAHVIVARRA
jgi:predicted acyl esterase